jgi:predicted  nucleic acid-binding Zn-ribbon protein
MTGDQSRLDDGREKRAYTRMQIKVIQRMKARRRAAGESAGDLDERLLELEASLAELDELVEGLRAKLGRPHRQLDRG